MPRRCCARARWCWSTRRAQTTRVCQHHIQPYLDHFGIPYATLDISTTLVTAGGNEYAVIIIGHRNLDSGGTRYLSLTEEAYISAAVNVGAGLVDFDNALSADGSTGRYQFIADVFGFGYNNQTSGSNVAFSNPEARYITQHHTAGQTITTTVMPLAGVTLPVEVSTLATTGTQPFLAVTSCGGGRAVQFGSYAWMSHSVKGPLFGLDDLVWRSVVWAARKPFVLQGLPPFVTMRLDDVSGPLWWIHIANEYGFIPWAGVFPDDLDAAEVADLAGLVQSGQATMMMHAFGRNHLFHFDHQNGQNFSDATMASHYLTGTQWFADRSIALGQYVVPHHYEIGTNAFGDLQAWGVGYVGTQMEPGQLEATAPWLQAGPFRKYESGAANSMSDNVYYADYLTIPGHPELNNKFFNCATEIRDVTGYEWLGHYHNSVPTAIADGAEWLKRALDSMAVTTMFSHQYWIIYPNGITAESWRQIMEGITSNIAGYNPQHVSQDYACAYARAVHDSEIAGGMYDPATQSVTVSLIGQTDMATRFYVFTEDGGQAVAYLVDVPAFQGMTQVTYTLPGALDHILVSPNPASVIAGGTRQFMAMGYDVSNNPIGGLAYTWTVMSGGGTIKRGGQFTAVDTPGAYINTVRATSGGVSGQATVNVTSAMLDHFVFDQISGPQVVGWPFEVTIRARAAVNNPVVTYNGTGTLGLSSGVVSPTTVTFAGGAWMGAVAIGAPGSELSLTVQDGDPAGTSTPFEVIPPPTCPCSIWVESDTPSVPDVTDGQPIQLGTKFRAVVNGYATGLKFYKGSENTGVHMGQLYAGDGTLLGEAAFTGETTSGWQTVPFTTPVPVTAGTTYVASYHSASGHFAFSYDYFGTVINNPPLTALADGTAGGNGVYKYSATPAFPTISSGRSNYWVDVVFSTLDHFVFMPIIGSPARN